LIVTCRLKLRLRGGGSFHTAPAASNRFCQEKAWTGFATFAAWPR